MQQGGTAPIFPSCGKIGCNGSLVNTHLRCLSLVGVGFLSRSVCSKLLSRILFSPRDQVVVASSTIDDILRVLARHQIISPDYQGVHTLCCGRIGPLSGSSTMASLGVGSLSHFSLRTRVHGGAGHTLGSGRSSQSSGSSIVPMSAKKMRAKRKLSDEDVWEWTDAKIIGTHVGLTHTPLHSYPAMQPKAKKPGSPPYTAITIFHLNGVTRCGHSPSDSRVVTTRSIIHC